MISCKCNSNFVSLGTPGARSDDSCCVRLCNWHGAGEQNATVRLRWGILWERPLTDVVLTEGGGVRVFIGLSVGALGIFWCVVFCGLLFFLQRMKRNLATAGLI